jgi:membrane protein DedA with SNARE-associated domain
VFLLIAVEEAGVPSPLPADLLVLLTSIQAREGHVELWQLLAVAELATIVGASCLYFLARWAGRDLVYRYGHYVRATPARLDQVEKKLHGAHVWTVALWRILPGLRVATALACGVFDVPFRIFLPGMAIGAFVYISIFAALGYVLGPPVVALLDALDLPIGSLLSLAVVVVVVTLLVRARRAPIYRPSDSVVGRFRAGAVAGIGAGVCAALTFNAAVGLVGVFVDLAPSTLPPASVQPFAGQPQRLVPLLLSLVALAASSALIGGIYGRWVQRGLCHLLPTDTARGLVFALVPWLPAVLVVPSTMGLAGPETVGLILIQTLQHAVFGVVLGLAYPLLRARLAPESRPLC